MKKSDVSSENYEAIPTISSISVDKSVHNLDAIESVEQQSLLGYGTLRVVLQLQCIHDLFEAQVKQNPNAVAVASDNGQLTYQQLNQQANQLAHYLRKLGVGPEVLVGICIERSQDMVVGLLAILKAGGAYLPLDPAYPQERIALMLADACVPILLTQQKQLQRLPQEDTQIVCIDTDWQAIAPESQANPVNLAQLENLAYVIYTSGSTGKPKGVMVEHGSLAAFTQIAGCAYAITPSDRILQFASISFDASVEEIFPCLVRGATLVLRNDEMLSSVPTFLQKCRDWGVTILDLPTAFWHQICLALPTTSSLLPQSLRLVIIGGERARPQQLDTWRQYVKPQVRLVNTYGPTEATVVATMCDLAGPQIDTTGRVLPIGRAIDCRVQLYVLDQSLQPVQVGEVGELYIGGLGVARGYLNQPQLTAENFITNPFCGSGERWRDGGLGEESKIQNPKSKIQNLKCDRLYKTGDLVRYRPDGNLEYLSRIDQQEKIRGFRIELGEIETVIGQHPAVRDRAVVAREDVPGDKRLVAYVVPSHDANALDGQVSIKESDTQQKLQWQGVFDSLYGEFDLSQQVKFYVKGWNSSYTGLPIPDEQVREWMKQTVDRILALQPRRVLELGCGGSGLMLFQIAPYCEQYCATDLSAKALSILQQQLNQQKQELPGVSLLHRAADDFTNVEANTFDAVLIVSVAQYFPSIEYLLKVMEGAVNAVEPGGFIFLGDVRNLSLLKAFHTSVQLHQASDTLSLVELRQQVQQQLAKEKQLAIDPAFFMALKQHLPKISCVEIRLERGRYHNELNKFRYDAILHIGPQTHPTINIPWIDWEEQGLTLASIRQILIDASPEVLGITGIPNARVLADAWAANLLESQDITTVGALRQVLQIAEIGVDPEEVWALGESLPYDIDIYWLDSSADGRYAVVFRRGISPAEVTIPGFEAADNLRWSDYANSPVKEQPGDRLIPLLRKYLEEKLPHYMIPSDFVLLDTLPLTLNGKVDRRALPKPERTRPNTTGNFVAPRTPVEEILAQIWAEVLGFEQVGIYDNFFELGGNSLQITQLLTQVQTTFKVELYLHDLFSVPTIAGFAAAIEEFRQAGSKALNTKATIELDAEAVLDDTICLGNLPIEQTNEPKCILITGATGFLGTFLLYELLLQTQADIHCLVRSDTEVGTKRLVNKLKSHSLWHDSFRSRIVPVIGDLSQPLLGLTVEQFQMLASKIDVIYHNGALVNFAYPYSALKAVNVLGTQEVLRLASQVKIKPVHFVSTLSIFPAKSYSEVKVIRESDSLDCGHMLSSGYDRSKWVADKIVSIARDRGLPVCIYRPGWISGHSLTGISNPDDLLFRLIRGCIELGSIPDKDIIEDLTPVDFVSQAIVHLSKQKNSIGKNFHLINPQPIKSSELVKAIGEFGYAIKQIPYEQWQIQLLHEVANSSDNALYPLLNVFAEKELERESHATMLHFDCQNTLIGLAGTSIKYPQVDAQLFNMYISYFIRSGLLEAPTLKDKYRYSLAGELKA